jgi:DMSO/TMAO reductase YedYZ molybdopterin-dependent catalytic subunit
MSTEDEQRVEAGAGGAPGEAGVTQTSDAEASASAGGAGPSEAEGPAYGAVRYTRRRMLILGGALVAGFAAVIAGLRAFGGSATEKVSSAISDQFGPFPVRSIESVPDVAADQWVVKVDGLVDAPLTVDRSTWTSLQRMQETVDFHCVEGWGVDDVRWGGVAPSVLLDQAGVKPEARYAVFHAYGGEYKSSLPLDLIRDRQTVLADSLNGTPLPPKHGGPLRLVVPKQLGYKSVKWVERIELSDKIVAGYWESNGYPEDAPVPGG